MIRRPPRSTRTDTLCPYTTLFRSVGAAVGVIGRLPNSLHSPAFDPVAPGSKANRRSEFSSRVELGRSEEHTSELQSLMGNSYAVFCLKKKNTAVTGRHGTTASLTDIYHV